MANSTAMILLANFLLMTNCSYVLYDSQESPNDVAAITASYQTTPGSPPLPDLDINQLMALQVHEMESIERNDVGILSAPQRTSLNETIRFLDDVELQGTENDQQEDPLALSGVIHLSLSSMQSASETLIKGALARQMAAHSKTHFNLVKWAGGVYCWQLVEQCPEIPELLSTFHICKLDPDSSRLFYHGGVTAKFGMIMNCKESVMEFKNPALENGTGQTSLAAEVSPQSLFKDVLAHELLGSIKICPRGCSRAAFNRFRQTNLSEREEEERSQWELLSSHCPLLDHTTTFNSADTRTAHIELICVLVGALIGAVSFILIVMILFAIDRRNENLPA